jgi:hypothetical protein
MNGRRYIKVFTLRYLRANGFIECFKKKQLNDEVQQ